MKLPFRFSIRDLFAATLVIALVVGWLLDHYALLRKVETWEFRATVCAKALEARGWNVRFTNEGVGVSLP